MSGKKEIGVKTLLVLRHAKSDWGDPSLEDHDRPLNERGKRNAARMGRLVKDEALIPDHIITSSATRAQSTARLLVAESGYPGDLEQSRDFYGAGPDRFIAALHDLPDTYGRVMLVGHNPGMQELVERLTGASVEMPTAALAEISLPVVHWQEIDDHIRGALVAHWIPKELD